VSSPRSNASARRQRRRAARPLTAALTELLHTHRPPIVEGHIWISMTPAMAVAIADIAARRTDSIQSHRDHPAHEAVRRPLRVSAKTAEQWRRDAWQAAGEGLIGAPEARLLAAQIDPPGAA
jgi:hypothetical protein